MCLHKQPSGNIQAAFASCESGVFVVLRQMPHTLTANAVNPCGKCRTLSRQMPHIRKKAVFVLAEDNFCGTAIPLLQCQRMDLEEDEQH